MSPASLSTPSLTNTRDNTNNSTLELALAEQGITKQQAKEWLLNQFIPFVESGDLAKVFQFCHDRAQDQANIRKVVVSVGYTPNRTRCSS